MKILVAANNPGGANAILPVVKLLPDPTVVLEGKAKDVFANSKITFIAAETLDDKRLERLFGTTFDLFFVGSSFGDTIDKRLLARCKEKNITSVYVLDFWTNYWQRFSTVGNKDFKFLPDYICVMDEKTKIEMIAEGFPAERLAVTGNPYFDHFTDAVTADHEDQKRLLFISQPIADFEFGFNEIDVLRDVISVLPADKQLVVRPHPRDEAGKFDALIGGAVSYDTIAAVEESVSQSSAIVGMNSMVLFQAALAGKNVISYQPNLKQPDALVTNSLGLSMLVKTKDTLRQALTEDHRAGKKSLEVVVKNATENVLNFINKLT